MAKTWHLKLDHTAQALAVLQRSALRRLDLAYSQLIDYDMALMRSYLPREAKRILDVGSGIAAIDVRLFQVYPDAHFYLLDATGLKVEYGTETEQAFYNSLATAQGLLERNSVPPDQIHLLEATPDYAVAVDGIDLALSLFSWGWHYPLETYAAAVAKAVVSGGVLIVDERTQGDVLMEKFHLEGAIILQEGARCFYRRREET